jgi:hypothetical protein
MRPCEDTPAAASPFGGAEAAAGPVYFDLCSQELDEAERDFCPDADEEQTIVEFLSGIRAALPTPAEGLTGAEAAKFVSEVQLVQQGSPCRYPRPLCRQLLPTAELVGRGVSRPRHARPKPARVGIISANVSSFGTFKKQYERFIEQADIFLLQEHRLLHHPTRYHSETVATAEHWLKARGLMFIFPPAIATKSSSAGTAIIWKQHVAVSLALEGVPGRCTYINVVNKKSGRMRIINVYVPVAVASITISPQYPGGFELDLVAPDCEGGTGELVYENIKKALANELGPKVGLQEGCMEPCTYEETTLAKAVKASLRQQDTREAAKILDDLKVSQLTSVAISTLTFPGELLEEEGFGADNFEDCA